MSSPAPTETTAPVAPKKRPGLARRRFGQLLFAGVLGAGLWARFVEAWWLKTTQFTVPVGLGGGQLKLLHLSDFHADPMPLDYLQRAVREGIALKPDLICVTGDFITRKYDQWDAYAQLLAELPKCAPTFASLGNHDGGLWARTIGYADTTAVRELIARANIQLLHNAHTVFETAKGQINLVGVGDSWAGELNPHPAFTGLESKPDRPTVLLSHNPDTKDVLMHRPWQLMLSGHTHGGQLDLPLLGTPFAPVHDKRYVRDLHQIADRWLHISTGVGCLHSVRFNCRPEISLLTLV